MAITLQAVPCPRRPATDHSSVIFLSADCWLEPEHIRTGPGPRIRWSRGPDCAIASRCEERESIGKREKGSFPARQPPSGFFPREQLLSLWQRGLRRSDTPGVGVP